MTLFDWLSNEDNDVSHEMASDNRSQPRTDALIELTLSHGDVELAGCHSQNISGKGVFIELPCDLDLASGTPISLRFHIWTGRDHIARFLRAKVVRSEQRGMAVRFTDHDMTTNAVVQDILYYQQYERRNEGRVSITGLSLGANFSAWVSRLMA